MTEEGEISSPDVDEHEISKYFRVLTTLTLFRFNHVCSCTFPYVG